MEKEATANSNLLNYVEQDVKDIINIVPMEAKYQLPKKFLWFKWNKVYKVRPFSFLDKINFSKKFGQKKFIEILSDPNDLQFELLHIEIAYVLTTNKGKDFKNFEDFCKKVIGFKQQMSLMYVGLLVRGAAMDPMLTPEEIKEAIEDLKKNPETN